MNGNCMDYSAREPAIAYVHTAELPRLMHELKISLFATTYQAHRILCLTAQNDGTKMHMLMRTLPRPTGLALTPQRMAVCTKNQIWVFRTVTNVHDTEGNYLPYDLVYAPRHAHVTGDIAAHQLCWRGDDLIVVNTRFSCLCTIDANWSFVPFWKPAFVKKYSPDDLCHLNGICSDDNALRYVTALAESTTPQGWRSNRINGGVLIDVPSGEIAARNLSMPHSPRLYDEKLWLLNSGTGELCTIDLKTGCASAVTALPGFLRGLCFYDRFAFVGLSKVREQKTFGGLPLEERFCDLKCAIFVIDTITGKLAGFIEFTAGIEELFDIQLLVGPRSPHIIGLQDATIDGLMILPP